MHKAFSKTAHVGQIAAVRILAKLVVSNVFSMSYEEIDDII
jgi:hypothetical protein